MGKVVGIDDSVADELVGVEPPRLLEAMTGPLIGHYCFNCYSGTERPIHDQYILQAHRRSAAVPHSWQYMAIYYIAIYGHLRHDAYHMIFDVFQITRNK